MKPINKWVAPWLLLFISVSVQAEDSASVCRLKIGQDWIPMGASQIQSCLKYVEAAASPGETQYAEFGNQSFSYKDGTYSRSTDGGRTWQRFDAVEAGTTIGALNVLHEGPAEQAKSEPDKPKPAKKKKQKDRKALAEVVPAAPASSEQDTEVSSANASADTAGGDGKFPVPKNSQGETSTSLAGTTTARRPAPETATTQAKRSTPTNAPGTRECQITTGSQWENVPAPSLAACGQLLSTRTANNPEGTGRAYWAGQYLLLHRNVLYRSADGRNWAAVP